MQRPLKPIQKKFVQEYLANGGDIKNAALSAGYSENTARVTSYKFLDNPKIKEMILLAQGNIEASSIKEAIAPYTWKAGILKRLVNAVISDDETQPINLEYGKIAIAAIAELNKMSGEYAPQKRLQLTVDVTKDRIIEAKKEYQEF